MAPTQKVAGTPEFTVTLAGWLSMAGVALIATMTCAVRAPQGDCWPVEESVSVTEPTVMSFADGW